jgi:hypothetical protein
MRKDLLKKQLGAGAVVGAAALGSLLLVKIAKKIDKKAKPKVTIEDVKRVVER